MQKLLYVSVIYILSIFHIAGAQEKTVQERLGYSKDTKLLIIHADDLGVSHAENIASFKALEKGPVNSASILVPCPWLPEVSAYAKDHPDIDLGLHLALTSEWKYYKWGPVMPYDKVKSLLNSEGYFYDNTADVLKSAVPAEAELELRAQIEHAIKVGIKPTHFDAHMGTVMSSPELLNIYAKLGEEYKVPVMLTKEMVPHIKTKSPVVVDRIIGASPENFKSSMKNFYATALRSLQPGLNVMIIHTAYDDAEMQAITMDHPDWGAAWRQADFDFFTSDECRKIIQDEKIQLITWREIKDKLIK